MISITNIQFTAADRNDLETGLLGWISCILDGRLQLDGISLRRTRDGRQTLSFPARRDGIGRQRYFYRPLDNHTREQIERQVFDALGYHEATASMRGRE